MLLMKLNKTFSPGGIWFAIKVILVFFAVETIAYSFGHFDVGTIAIVVLSSALILFIIAFFNVHRKDRSQKNRFAI
jgi:hypothetical protein